MPTTNLTAFEIMQLNNSAGRFLLSIRYYYDYDIDTGNYTNIEEFAFNIPIEEFSINSIYNNTSSISESCELNAISKCMFRFNNDMYDVTQTYSQPLSLYQYIVNNVL